MMVSSSLFGVALLAATAAAQGIKGFNYGSTVSSGGPKFQADFEREFNQAKALAGAPGFTSARLYTMIQGATANAPIAAIPAAIATQTRLLLGLWASAGEDGIRNEIAAFNAAISQYGTAFTNLIDGISVGSEDLYRISPTGIENMSGIGAGPAEVANYINEVRNALRGTPASSAPIGHVDTWTAWVNGSNQAVIDASDFIGMDAYPYFQNTIPNSIDLGQEVFNDALGATRNAVNGKPVWITETGWPVSGATENQAVANIPNAESYWKSVGCQYFGNTNTWWYTLQDALPDTPSPSFGIVGSNGGSTPLFDLTCNAGSASSSLTPSNPAQASSVSSAVSAAATGGAAAPTEGSGSPGPSALKDSSAVNAPSGSVSSAHYAPGGSSAAAAPESDKPSAVASTVYETTSLCPVTMTGAKGAVSTVLSTSTFTVTSCPGGCSHAPTGQPSAAPAPPAAPSQPPAAAPSPTSKSSSAGACPADLSGNYEFPHLMVPVDSTKPDTALGTSYNGTFSSTISTLYNFDIPPADAGKTCTLVFLMPTKQDLQTSNYELSGSGGIDVKGLSSPATQGTSYSNVPATSEDVGSVPSVSPGNSYVISSGPCAAGKAIGYEVSATGSLGLNYFQDYNPSPIGLYITVC